MKLIKAFVVPVGAISAGGKSYQQGQRIPAGATLSGVDGDVLKMLEAGNYIEVRRSEPPKGRGKG